ncbi:hypothetical protein ig2599ANME_0443 [groundwater metagenome]
MYEHVFIVVVFEKTIKFDRLDKIVKPVSVLAESKEAYNS